MGFSLAFEGLKYMFWGEVLLKVPRTLPTVNMVYETQFYIIKLQFSEGKL